MGVREKGLGSGNNFMRINGGGDRDIITYNVILSVQISKCTLHLRHITFEIHNERFKIRFL